MEKSLGERALVNSYNVKTIIEANSHKNRREVA